MEGDVPVEGPPVLVLGAGPAGITAGYLLACAGVPVVVLEAEDQVGGLAKTVTREGFRFDLGGHRFFTKSAQVEHLWQEALGDELLIRQRRSRIFWHGRFLDYPLRPGDVVRKLGACELVRCGASYARAAARRRDGEETLEQWVSNRFGRRLFELFFRSYTEKVWGVPCSEIRAEWAAQRIRGLSFRSVVRTALRGNRGNQIRSLIDEFAYPRYGPGQMWEAFATELVAHGGELRLRAPVEALEVEGGVVRAVVAAGQRLPCRAVISSLPLGLLPGLVGDGLVGDAGNEARAAADGLRYRDFLTVAVALDRESPFPDTWLYVHEPTVKVARIQSYGAWSPWMLPRPDVACLGLEYFCFAEDELWRMPDDELRTLAVRELGTLGLARASDVSGSWVVRVPRAYPMYDGSYADRVATVRRWLDSIGNLQQVGRNGLHRYNNSDHSMLTAICAVENLLHDARHDLWSVNADGVYLEEGELEEHPYRRAPEHARV